MCANSEGSGEIARMRRLAWAFAGSLVLSTIISWAGSNVLDMFAGQSMGPDGHGGECLGCGNQENFINCADIAIGDRVIAPLPQPVTTTTSSPPVTKPPQAQNPYQVLAIGMLPNGAIPTVHASYGAYNHVDPPSAVAYNAMPIPQPPTAHSSHSQVHIQSGKVQDWSGNQHNQHSNTHQPAQVAYTTIQETQPQPANNIRPKVQIIQKPNPYAKHRTQSQAHLAQRSQPQQKHFSPQPPNGPAAPAHAYHQAHIKPKPAHQVAHYPQYGTHVPKERSYPKPQASSYPHSDGHFNQPNSHVPQTNSHAPQPSSHLHHPNHHVPQPNNHVPQPNSHVPQPNIHMPQANSHVPQTSSSVQHLAHMQAVSYVPHANNHVVQATSHVQPNSHATQQQTYVPQGPTYPQQAVHAPQPPAPTDQQPYNPVHTPHHLQSKTYAPAAPAPPAKPSTNVATQTKTSNPMQIDLKSIKAMFPQLAESFDWMNEVATPPNQNSADPSQGSYPGYEPGEYPEPGESPPQQRPSSSNEQSSSYMQGYNDAMRALKQQFGISETTNEAGSSSTGKRCPGGMKPTCKGINQWQGQPQFDSWCTTTCSAGECPANFCSCTCPGAGTFKSGPNCRGVDPSKGSSMDEWCTLNCKGGHCPPDLCVCL